MNTCEGCLKKFRPVGHTNGRFCKKQCWYEFNSHKRRFPQLADKAWLSEKLETLSMKAIAQEAGCGETLVHKRVHQLGIKGKNRSERLTGRERSASHRRNIGLANRGKFAREGNPNWKGGVSKARTAFMATGAYKDWRKSVFERDNYTCQQCGERGVYLHAHHIKPYSKYPELRLDNANGQTLCRECHRSLHGLTAKKTSLIR